MRDDQHRFLMLVGRPPVRLTSEQAAWLLNCQPHDLPILVAARLLRPLGDPQPNSVKYFATIELLDLANNRVWLNKATTAMSRHWKEKNLRKAGRVSGAEGLAGRLELAPPRGTLPGLN